MPRILLVKTSSLGDVVHNLPVVADIRSHFPDAVIDWVVEENFADIPALHPGVQRVLPVAMRRWRRQLLRPSAWREIAAFRRALREVAYDAVIDTQGLLKSAVLTSLARGPSHGQDRATVRESFAARFYAHTYNVARGRHAVVRNRELAALALGYALPTTPPDYGIRTPVPPALFPAPVRRYGSPPDFHDCSAFTPHKGGGDLSGLPYVVCLHGTSRASKEWPERYWRELSERLANSGYAAIFPWGNETEKARAERLGSGDGSAIVLPRLGLRDLAAILGRAQAVVGVDSGLTHLACALDRPTVAIYTDTSPVLTGVYPRDPSRAVNLGEAASAPSLARGPRLGPIGEAGTTPTVDAVWSVLARWVPAP